MSKNPERIWLSSPHMSGLEQQLVQEAFASNWIAPLGPNVTGFEKDLEQYTGIQHALVLNSGTAAIHLALILLGVGRGDEVICQSMTFAASANPVVYLGATPVFVDSEPSTWNMSPEYLEKAILDRIGRGKKPKAIIPVHLYGMPAQMKEIVAIAAKYGIPIVEDAAEALGSAIAGKKCGTFGLLNVLSFNGNKIITTSGGGALLSDNEALIGQARHLATQALDDAPHYQHSKIGYNYRLSNILAAIGRGQMTVLDDRVASRRANTERYKNYFNSLKGKGYDIEIKPEPEKYFSNRWLTAIVAYPLKNRGTDTEMLRVALNNANIDSRPLWKPMHLQPVYKDAPFFGDGTSEWLFKNGLCLPSGSNLSDDDFDRIFNILDSVLI